jgi:Uma2 family endonuclease
MSPANRTHGSLQIELGSLIRNHLLARSSACSVVARPGIVPQVPHNVRIPALAVTCSDYTIEEATLTDPVLIVEILSPSNAAETWANVWTYTTIATVREILVLHSVSVTAELLRRQADGAWPKEPAMIAAGELELASIGFQVPLIDIYRTTRLARG